MAHSSRSLYENMLGKLSSQRTFAIARRTIPGYRQILDTNCSTDEYQSVLPFQM